MSAAARPRIVMLGTGDFALPTFLRLLDDGHDVAALITPPDRPQGRKQELIPSRIKVAALERGVRVEQPEDINVPAGVELVRSLAADLLVTAAYGQILSAEVLGIPRLGGLNLHGSILPAYRGAAPVARAIQDGATETGVTVIRMTPRIDAGGMLAAARTPIGLDETAGELEARLAELGAPLIAAAVADLAAGRSQVIPQDRSRVTRAPKLTKEDGRIDWSRPARAVHDLGRSPARSGSLPSRGRSRSR
jgi:methionyl-tRNA formyltransferase